MSATLAGMQSQVLARMEELENEVMALCCVTGLLKGFEPGNNPVDISELSYIIDPIVDRQKAIVDEVREMFQSVGFTPKSR